MKKTKFSSSSGMAIPEKKAQIYGEEIAKIQKEKGGNFRPSDVVEAARPADNPLHDYFDWNDKAAAERWRINQAGCLIRHLEVTVITDGVEQKVRAFLNVTVEEGGEESFVYTDVRTVGRDEQLRHQVIEGALAELKGWQRRYRTYQELGEIFSAIEKTQSLFSK